MKNEERETEKNAHMEPAMPQLLFEDNHCLCFAKPAGLLTQGVPHGIATLESHAKEYLRTTYNKTGNVYLGIPHRLDRPVSGVVLFARSSKAAARLAEQFAQRQVSKVYWALVEAQDRDLPAEGVWEDWLLKDPEESRSSVVAEGTPHAKFARLRYHVRGREQDRIWLELHLETGRMHQIRVQAASRGFPVLGDQQYGATTTFGPDTTIARDRIIALHGRSLCFLHPIRYNPILLTAPLSQEWRASFPSVEL
jgi:23S rRNA pseudouridine1911/1915/1917 synthase